MNGEGLGCLWIMLAFGAFVYWVTSPSQDEIIGYSARCANDVIVAPDFFYKELDMTFKQIDDARSQCEAYAALTTRYVINKINGTVTYRIGDLQLITKQSDCTILDTKNWNCEFSDGSGRIGFLDGLPSMFKEDIRSGYFAVRRWQYHILNILNLFGPIKSSLLVPSQSTQFR